MTFRTNSSVLVIIHHLNLRGMVADCIKVMLGITEILNNDQGLVET